MSSKTEDTEELLLDQAAEAEVEEVEGEDVPLSEATISFKLVGTTLLLMKSNAGVNPLNELVKRKAALVAIRPKQRTDEDIMEIYRLDFLLALYHDLELGPYVPGVNVEAAMLVAAKMERQGPKFQAGVKILEDKLPLQYKGPRTPDELWKDPKGRFVDIRPTKLKASSSLMTCRPCFPAGWSLQGTVGFNAGIVDRRQVIRWLQKVGDVGLCDYRRRYGKSAITIEA